MKKKQPKHQRVIKYVADGKITRVEPLRGVPGPGWKATGDIIVGTMTVLDPPQPIKRRRKPKRDSQ